MTPDQVKLHFKSLRMYTAENVVTAETLDDLRDLALRGLEAQWIGVQEKLPTERGWYGVLDADNEPRAGLFVNDQWAANAVMPIRAWCNFPPLPPGP